MKQLKLNSKFILGIVFICIVLLLYFIISENIGKPNKEAIKNQEQEIYNKRSALPFSTNKLSVFDLKQILKDISGPSPESLKNHYRMYFRYPPNSRPLLAQMQDLIFPESLKNIQLPIYNKDDEEKKNPEYVFQFYSNSINVNFKNPFIATLKLRRKDNNELVKPEIISARTVSDIKTGLKFISKVDYYDDGTHSDKKKNDNIYTFKWTPFEKNRLHWGEVLMQVVFKTPNGTLVNYEVPFFSTPIIPAIFTGNIEEYLEAGSLKINFEVEVYKKGYYIIEANLFSEHNDEPVAFSVSQREINLGFQIITMQFYGTIFRDYEHAGRFFLRNLRGTRQNLPFSIGDLAAIAKMDIHNQPDNKNEPLQEKMPTYKEEFITKEYSLKDFTDEPFKSAAEIPQIKEF